MAVIVGVASDEAETVKGAEFERAPELDTVIEAVPAEAISAAEMRAVRYGGGFGFACVDGGWTNVVARGEPFQSTTEPFTKFVPFTVRVNPVGLHAGVVFDEVVEDETEVIVGGEIVNGIGGADMPPPGPGVNRTMWGV
jgi:hypothetical protein